MTIDDVEVERWAVISTAHVPLAEMEAAIHNEITCVDDSSGGWRVRVGLEDDIKLLSEHFSGAFVSLLEALAHKDFYGVRFDQDAEELQGYPTYDW